MRFFKYLYLTLGLALFVWLVAQSDLPAVGEQLVRIGWFGFLAVTLIYGLAFLVDTISWQLTFSSIGMDRVWLARLFRIRVVGEAFNSVIPAGSMGGEPVKALMLKRRYGIGYKESAATLVLAKTINLLGLVVFLSVGFVLLLSSPVFPYSLKLVAGLGLAALATGTVLFFLVQRFSISSWLTERAGRWPLLGRLADFIDHVREVDAHFIGFYAQRTRRFISAVLLALLNWLIGAGELYATMYFLGYPVSIVEAIMIESMAQLVRAGTFFIPLSVGAQDGAFVVTIGLLTGNADLGLAAALIRRCREFVWIAPGFVLGSLRSPESADEIQDTRDAPGR